MTWTLNISGDPNWSGFWLFALISVFCAWLFALVSLLKRQDLKDVDKIVWVIVLCILNILGALLYWLLAPAEPKAKSAARSRAMSDKELKEYFNRRGDHPEA